jgi:3-deoxy-manno-octulosonate cytidylyltransferase (CMP-KDO synthetase)
MKIIGIVPARMAASRFPGKPLRPILGRALLEHVVERARKFPHWDALAVATCDEEIRVFCESKDYPVIMTADTHVRALDRVTEAAGKLGIAVAEDDIVINVQGDEPMLDPGMIEAVVKPFGEDPEVHGTMLAMPIVDEDLYRNPDILKIAHNLKGDVLYTSRNPIPWCKKFSPELGAKRIGGIFAFRWHFLKTFTALPPSPLEIQEACDSNRLYDYGYTQRLAVVPPRPFYSVDSPEDAERVAAALEADPLWGSY